MTDCLECSNATSCDLCDSGLYFDSELGSCAALADGVSAFFESDTGQKVECMGGCQSCTTADTCDVCDDGYYVDDGICLGCDPSCKTCSGGTST